MRLTLPKWTIKGGWSDLRPIPWEYLTLLLALSILFINVGYALYAIYISIKGGNMPNIEPIGFLISSLVMGGIGFLVLILTIVLFVGKLFTKDPITEGIKNIQSDIRDMKNEIKDMAKEIHNLSITLNKFIRTFHSASQKRRYGKSSRDYRDTKKRNQII